jgi:hypothetical protein
MHENEIDVLSGCLRMFNVMFFHTFEIIDKFFILLYSETMEYSTSEIPSKALKKK